VNDSDVKPEAAQQVLATYATRNGWPADKAATWGEALADAHTWAIGWDEEDLYTLARAIAASGLPKSRNAALYVQSLTGSNVQGVAEQTAQAAASTITTTAKAAGRSAGYGLPFALSLGVLYLLGRK
jgi:hypothetical protein